MDIAALQTTLRTFAAERNWQPFHTPKNLTAALMVEAAELLEIFQWMTADESKAAHLYPAMKERIADEVADVFLYLLQVADRCAIDLTDAVANKLVKNASKHPVPDSASSHVVAPLPADHVAQPNDVVAQSAPDTVVATTSTAAQTHVLVDWENVQPKGQDIQRLVPDVTDVWLFHGPGQKNVNADQAQFGQRVTLVPIARAGKNSLDFHLSFYIGYIAARNPLASCVVLSNDKGYMPMLEHAEILGFSARWLSFRKDSSVTRKAPAKKVVSKIQSPAPPQPPATAIDSGQTLTVAPVSRPVANPTLRAKNNPIAAATKVASANPSPALSQKSVDAKKVAAARKVPGAKKVALKNTNKASAPANLAIKPLTPDAKAVTVKLAIAKSAKVKSQKVAGIDIPMPVAAWSDDAPGKRSQAPELIKAVRHVQDSLQKSANKPGRIARLRGAIKSLLPDEIADESVVSVVLEQLQDSGFVTVNEKGVVSFGA